MNITNKISVNFNNIFQEWTIGIHSDLIEYSWVPIEEIDNMNYEDLEFELKTRVVIGFFLFNITIIY